MMDLMDVSNEIQETLGRSYNVPDDIDEDELLGGKITVFECSILMRYGLWPPRKLTSLLLFLNVELDALEADMGFETEADGVPSYLQPDKESDLEGELHLPSAPTGHAVPGGRTNAQV